MQGSGWLLQLLTACVLVCCRSAVKARMYVGQRLAVRTADCVCAGVLLCSAVKARMYAGQRLTACDCVAAVQCCEGCHHPREDAAGDGGVTHQPTHAGEALPAQYATWLRL
jgi:hypothetical protein